MCIYMMQCWTYIRVSVHGVLLPGSGGGRGSVAVGDTFLFSPTKNATQQFPALFGSTAPGAHHERSLLPLVGDHVCITHAIPYWHALPGAGAEDVAVHRLLTCIRHPHM